MKGNYQPISLMNINVKIYMEILANRTQQCIKIVIHHNQGWFIPSMQSWCNISINFKKNNNPGWSYLAFKFILLSKKIEKAIPQKYSPGMFTSAPVMFVSPPDSCIRSWCPCDGIRRWGPGETLHCESGALGNGVSAVSEGPRSPSPFLPVRSTWTWPWLWPQSHLVFSLQNHLLFISLHESESEVAQSCPTLCDPMDCSQPGSSIHGIFQAKVLEWVAISFSRGSSRPMDRTWVSRVAGRCFTFWATRDGCDLLL